MYPPGHCQVLGTLGNRPIHYGWTYGSPAHGLGTHWSSRCIPRLRKRAPPLHDSVSGVTCTGLSAEVCSDDVHWGECPQEGVLAEATPVFLGAGAGFHHHIIQSFCRSWPPASRCHIHVTVRKLIWAQESNMRRKDQKWSLGSDHGGHSLSAKLRCLDLICYRQYGGYASSRPREWPALQGLVSLHSP